MKATGIIDGDTYYNIEHTLKKQGLRLFDYAKYRYSDSNMFAPVGLHVVSRTGDYGPVASLQAAQYADAFAQAREAVAAKFAAPRPSLKSRLRTLVAG